MLSLKCKNFHGIAFLNSFCTELFSQTASVENGFGFMVNISYFINLSISAGWRKIISRIGSNNCFSAESKNYF